MWFWWSEAVKQGVAVVLHDVCRVLSDRSDPEGPYEYFKCGKNTNISRVFSRKAVNSPCSCFQVFRLEHMINQSCGMSYQIVNRSSYQTWRKSLSYWLKVKIDPLKMERSYLLLRQNKTKQTKSNNNNKNKQSRTTKTRATKTRTRIKQAKQQDDKTTSTNNVHKIINSNNKTTINICNENVEKAAAYREDAWTSHLCNTVKICV